MSQENVEIIRGLLARWERGETTTTVEAFDPQVEFTRTGGGSDVLGYTTKSHGIEGLWAALGAWTDGGPMWACKWRASPRSVRACSCSLGNAASVDIAVCR